MMVIDALYVACNRWFGNKTPTPQEEEDFLQGWVNAGSPVDGYEDAIHYMAGRISRLKYNQSGD